MIKIIKQWPFHIAMLIYGGVCCKPEKYLVLKTVTVAKYLSLFSSVCASHKGMD